MYFVPDSQTVTWILQNYGNDLTRFFIAREPKDQDKQVWFRSFSECD